MQITKRAWEVPEIDLNFRHYTGHPSDAIKLLKRNIERYLIRDDVSQNSREIYSAIYHALDYYKSILYSSANDFCTGPTFLNYSLVNMRKDFEFLSQKFNSKDPEMPPVIKMSGRIKSPISALEKIKDKIDEYLEKGSDFRYLNESLRDFMGVRIIVDPPKQIKELGPMGEELYLQEVLYTLLKFHGLTNQEVVDNFKFIPVNTKNHPDKLERMRQDGRRDYLTSLLTPYVKNYVDHPKENGYQSFHICATPEYSAEVKQAMVPSFIISSAKTEYSFEYQLRTQAMDDSAEHGDSAHEDYKELGSYHRLSIPFYIEAIPGTNEFAPLNLEESCKKHFGFVPFLRVYDEQGTYIGNMTLLDFRDIFTSYERDAIIDGRKRICYAKDTLFEATDATSCDPVISTVDKDNVSLRQSTVPILLTASEIEVLKASEEGCQLILEASNVADSILGMSDENEPTTLPRPNIEIYTLETSEDRNQSKEKVKVIDQAPNVDSQSDDQIK